MAARRKKTTKKATSKKATTRKAPASRGGGGGQFRDDFSGVEVRVLVPEGKYDARVKSVDLVKKKSKEPYYHFKMQPTSGDKKTKKATLHMIVSTGESSMWKLAQVLKACGLDIPEGPLAWGKKDVVGKDVVVSVEHENYNGNLQARVVGVANPEDENADPETSDSDVPDADEVNEMDGEELAELVEDLELGVELTDYKTLKKKRAAVIEALEEIDEEGEDEGEEEGEEEEEEGEAVSEADVKKMDEEELGELVEEHELDVDLDDYKTLKKKRAAVVEALEDAELLG